MLQQIAHLIPDPLVQNVCTILVSAVVVVVFLLSCHDHRVRSSSP